MKSFLAIVAIPLGTFALLAGGEWYTSCDKLPPANKQSLQAYLDWRPDASSFVHLRNGHLLVLGWGVGLLPSGPSALVFDEKGQLVDSTVDLGEDPRFDERWKIEYPLQLAGRELIDPVLNGMVPDQRR